MPKFKLQRRATSTWLEEFVIEAETSELACQKLDDDEGEFEPVRDFNESTDYDYPMFVSVR